MQIIPSGVYLELHYINEPMQKSEKIHFCHGRK